MNIFNKLPKNNKGFAISGALLIKLILIAGTIYVGWEGGKAIGVIPSDNVIDGLIGSIWIILTQWIPMIFDFLFNFTGDGFGFIPFIVNNFLLIILVTECFILVLAINEESFIDKFMCFITYNVKLGHTLWFIIIGAIDLVIRAGRLVKPI